MQRWKSSKWTPSAQPTPHSSSSERPVKSSQVWLKNVHRPSVRDIHSSTGAASAMFLKRLSVSRICCSSCSGESPAHGATPSSRASGATACGGGGAPAARPRRQPVAIAGIGGRRQLHERLRPGAVPGAVLAQREEDLAQQVVAPGARLDRDVAEEEFVEHRLDAQVERRERLAPVVGHEQPLDQLAQRLPRRVALARVACPRRRNPGAAGAAAPSGRRGAGPGASRRPPAARSDRDAAARRHLADVRRQHLQPVIDVAQRRQQPLQRVDPGRIELVVVVAVFDRSQQAVDVRLLGLLQRRRTSRRSSRADRRSAPSRRRSAATAV